MKRLQVGRELLQGAVQLVFPAVCGACSRSLNAGESNFCSECRSALTTDPFSTCPFCAATVGFHASVEDGCPQCRTANLHFEKAIRLGPYENLLREIILRMKNQKGETLAELVGELWAEY